MRALVVAFVVALFVLSCAASAQEISKVILVTDIAAIDGLVASAAGTKDGIPVLVLPGGVLTDDVKAELSGLGATDVIVVGGPAVVRAEIEEQLRALGYNAVRLWGLERTETSLAVARHFWPENITCAVLVDDTGDAAADAALQARASVAAAQNKCPLLVVPQGKVPATVLATMRELGIRRTRWFGRAVSAEVSSALREFNATEAVGELEAEQVADADATSAAAGKPLRLVVVAAPRWQAVLGIVGQPNDNSVVRIVSNASNLSAIVDLVKSKNITDVKVVGFPALAQEVADALALQGINAIKVSAETASDVAKAALERVREQWQERRAAALSKHVTLVAMIRERIESMLSDVEQELDMEGEELSRLEMNATGDAQGDIAALRVKLAEIRAQLRTEVQARLAAGDIEGAKELVAKARQDYLRAKWLVRSRVAWDWESDLEDENAASDALGAKLRTRVTEARMEFARLKLRCNDSMVVQKLVEEADALADAAANATEDRKATLLLMANKLVDTAETLSATCSERAVISARAQQIAQAHASRALAVREVSARILAIARQTAEELEKSVNESLAVAGISSASAETAQSGYHGGR